MKGEMKWGRKESGVQKMWFDSNETAAAAQLCANIEQSVCQSVHLSRGLQQVQHFIYLPTL